MHVVVSQGELARRAGVSAMAISKAVASGRLDRGPEGIDLEARKTIDYLATSKHQRRDGQRRKANRKAVGKSKAKPKQRAARAPRGKKKKRAAIAKDGPQKGALRIDGETFNMADLRHTIAKADKVEQEIAIRRGELVERADVHRVFAHLYAVHSSQLKTLADKLGPDVAAAFKLTDTDTPRIQEIMNMEMRRALSQIKQEMNDYLESMGNGGIEVEPRLPRSTSVKRTRKRPAKRTKSKKKMHA